MKTPKLPENEDSRLQALRELGVLDTEPEHALDRLTQFTAHVFDVPIALISLVDKDRQWFKSRFGLEAQQTPRDISFCGHAILEDKVFVVPNATTDIRFRDNPLVQHAPYIRFYAGAPLTTSSGLNIGTVCIIDLEPRQFSDGDCDILKRLSEDIVRLLEKSNVL
ncbi:GAF domain-containing protein [Pseudoalteromonas piscicida]|uniref:Histidine kinase n=1 Tax=Pseudoalteromonas piscicida TaxID=43662 RepID=A0A2A5JPK9_PSEO7|nr:GAF domain-containing protein [Pseudoalteromonas piscicida]PCK31366.1 histidine kinase [Pseudoalteromonas piscicida]